MSGAGPSDPPSVSYVITVYNKAQYLPGVIDSLSLQEGNFEREFIFIDDGSTDDSAEAVTKATRGWDNVRILSQKNAGPAVATNAGVVAAKGDLIKPVDSDDVLAPYATRILMNILEREQAVLAFGWLGYYESPDKIAFAPAPDLSSNPGSVEVFTDPLMAVIDQGFAGVSHMLFRRSTFREAGSCDPGLFAQDHSLFLRLALQGRIAKLNHLLCLGPTQDPNRVMANKAQVIHDSTLALARLLQQNPDLARRYHRAVTRTIADRANKWARRELGRRSPLGLCFLLNALAKLPGVSLPPDFLANHCRVFLKNAEVRLPEDQSQKIHHPSSG
jgi:glycosyltransferase involved in cell wall biosynthesis